MTDRQNNSESSGPSQTDVSEGEVEKGKNKYTVKCKFCPSKILNPLMGTYLISEVKLPMMTRQKNVGNDEEIQYEILTQLWQIDDMYMFENISFSKTVDNTKYLACADCEIGPIGLFNLDTKISYIALERMQPCIGENNRFSKKHKAGINALDKTSCGC